VNTHDARRGQPTVTLEKEHHFTAGLDDARLDGTLSVDGPIEARGDGGEAVLGMPGNANRVATNAFNPVVAALRLDINQRTGTQTGRVDGSRRFLGFRGYRHKVLCEEIGAIPLPEVERYPDLYASPQRNVLLCTMTLIAHKEAWRTNEYASIIVVGMPGWLCRLS
jgi:hypothetical protein